MDRDEAMKTIEDRLSYLRAQRTESPETYGGYDGELSLLEIYKRLMIGKSLERAYGHAIELYKSLEEESEFWKSAGKSPLDIKYELDLKNALKMFEVGYNRLRKNEERLIEKLFHGDNETDEEADKETDIKFRKIVGGIFDE